jgi:hypothetical protein
MTLNEGELVRAGFRRAGSVVPDPLKTVRVHVDPDWRGFVVYIMVVNQEVKKVGTTGRNGSSLAKRMAATFSALRQVIVGPVPGRPAARWRSRPLDPFKTHAPASILAGHEVQLWASVWPSFEIMMAKETELNNKYTPEWTKEGRRERYRAGRMRLPAKTSTPERGELE